MSRNACKTSSLRFMSECVLYIYTIVYRRRSEHSIHPCVSFTANERIRTFSNSVLPRAADSAHWLAGWLAFLIPTHLQHLNLTKTTRVPPKTYYLLIKFNVFCIKPKNPFIYLWQKEDGDVKQHWSLHFTHGTQTHIVNRMFPQLVCMKFVLEEHFTHL